MTVARVVATSCVASEIVESTRLSAPLKDEDSALGDERVGGRGGT
jgi:hypothetical protein